MLDTMKQYLAGKETEMLALLEKVVRINSYTGNKAGVDEVADAFTEVLEEMGLTVRRDKQGEAGDNLVAETPARANGRGVMLCGHMDTVFPVDMGFDCFDVDGEYVSGPGVYDMKGGLVAGIYALKALDAAGLLMDMPLAFVFNSDEEIGSRYSAELVKEEARKSDVGFVMEGSRPAGEIIIGRKGRSVFTFEAKGKAQHAGYADETKASAIKELAYQIGRLEALNDLENGTSLNVGIIEGGMGPNTVSENAKAEVEYRYTTEEARNSVWAAVEEIAASPQNPNVTCEATLINGKPAFQTTDKVTELYDLVKGVGDELDIPVGSQFQGGGSDANLMAGEGVPVLCGMGPGGGNFHQVDEYMVVSTMVDRTLLAAESIRRAYEKYCK